MSVLIIFSTGWAFTLNDTYALPEFKTDSGILVSRISGDPNNQNQIKLVNTMTNSEIMPPDHVMKLPVRIGFPYGQTSINDQGHSQAREYGDATQAAVVLWGKQLEPIKAATQVTLNLTFIKNDALFKSQQSEVIGALSATELSDLNSSLDRLSEMLPRFLEGYRRYHKAQTEREFEQARKSFSNAIKAVDLNFNKETGNHATFEKIQASLHFYLGNTLQALGYNGEAINEYKKAVNKTLDKYGSPLYIEAASNLGWLLRVEDKIIEATEILSAIDSTCERADRKKWACAYVWYNLGHALSDQKQYQQASVFFNLAINRIREKSDRDKGDIRLEAYSHQNLAYSLVRHATTLETNKKPSFVDDAQKAWEKGQTALDKAEFEIPEYFQITLGRIHIERHHWNQAIEVLTSLVLEQKWEMKATVNSLLAGAYSCISDVSKLKSTCWQ